MIGFVILSHNNPSQLHTLCSALNAVHGDPPIAIHHDTSQSSIEHYRFAANICFVDRPNRTSWADWSVTGAFLRSLDLLYQRADPEWFVLLSAADYPIATAAELDACLHNTTADAFLDLRPIHGDRPTRHIGKADNSLAHHTNPPLATRRYLHARMSLPSLKLRPDERRRSIRLPFLSPSSPFGPNYRCYVGSQWVMANRRAASRILNPSASDMAYKRYLRDRWHADESYINTVLGNDESLTIDVDPRRFTKWEVGSANPCLLSEHDFNAIDDSGYMFARKLSCPSKLIDMINARLGVRFDDIGSGK